MRSSKTEDPEARYTSASVTDRAGCARDFVRALGEAQHRIAKAAVGEPIPHKRVGLQRCRIATGRNALGACGFGVDERERRRPEVHRPVRDVDDRSRLQPAFACRREILVDPCRSEYASGC